MDKPLRDCHFSSSHIVRCRAHHTISIAVFKIVGINQDEMTNTNVREFLRHNRSGPAETYNAHFHSAYDPLPGGSECANLPVIDGGILAVINSGRVETDAQGRAHLFNSYFFLGTKSSCAHAFRPDDQRDVDGVGGARVEIALQRLLAGVVGVGEDRALVCVGMAMSQNDTGLPLTRLMDDLEHVVGGQYGHDIRTLAICVIGNNASVMNHNPIMRGRVGEQHSAGLDRMLDHALPHGPQQGGRKHEPRHCSFLKRLPMQASQLKSVSRFGFQGRAICQENHNMLPMFVSGMGAMFAF